MFDAFLGKFSKDQRNELSEEHGMLWEDDDAVSNCRGCESLFTVSLRKHHCRGCGGVFCDRCCDPFVSLRPDHEPVRACFGCERGETPGEQIVQLVKTVLAKRGPSSALFPPAGSIMMHSGSLYGDDESRSVRLDGTSAHKQGYFEIVNKSNDMMAVKLLHSGGDHINELCRPCYIAGECCIHVCHHPVQYSDRQHHV